MARAASAISRARWQRSLPARGIAAPKGLPPAIREQLASAVQKAAADPEFQAKAAGYFAPLRHLPPARYEAELREGDAEFRQMWKDMPWGENK